MSSNRLHLTCLLTQVALGVLNFFILSISVSLAFFCVIFSIHLHAGLELIYGAFLFDQRSLQLIQVKQLIRRQNLDIAHDILALCKMFPIQVRIYALLLLFVSFFLICLSGFGVYSAVTKSIFVTKIFVISCGMAVLSLQSLGILLVFQFDNLEQSMRLEIREYIKHGYSPMADDIDMTGNVADFIQARFECCGVANSSDYGQKFFPKSCCRLTRYKINGIHGSTSFFRIFDSCPQEPTSQNSNMSEGCFLILWSWIMKNVMRVGAFLWLLWILGLLSGVLLQMTAVVGYHDYHIMNVRNREESYRSLYREL